MQDDILKLAFEVSRITGEKIAVIDRIMLRTQILSMNARLESTRAGEAGLGFGVVAREMGAVADEVNALSAQLQAEIAHNTARMETAGRQMMLDFKGQRYADLARNVVEIIDRNLYERSCDVRWWATDSAVVEAAQQSTPDVCAYASGRLATILRSYTVYLDLWIADRRGRVIASGRRQRFPDAVGQNVAMEPWFRKGLATRDGDDFAVCDIGRNPVLGNAQTATYSTAIRRDGAVDGEPVGVLGIFFDWEPQARDIVQGVALSEAERMDTRVMLLNGKHQIIAASDKPCSLMESYPIRPDGAQGFYQAGQDLVCYALTPGYETYKGLGWYGCIESRSQLGKAR
ncbi:MAG: chemotaxis protein [Sphingomonadales bacterium]|nr:MAG: chemotaxis protein [Sphingomonadales bacterium]TNF05379.1 MAG: chemotaxis protein [Sphingomonadales bacterium]